jgi:hypothetical protein
MSTAAVSSSLVQQHPQPYFQERGADQRALGVALKSGDLAGAQAQFNAIQSLAQSGPFAATSGSPTADAYKITQRQQDFAAIGQALQAGDLSGAQAAFAQLQATFHKPTAQPQQQADQNPAVVVNIGGQPSQSSTSSGGTSQSAPAGGEIVLNLGNITSGEQITIGVSNSSSGEQVTIGVANQANQAPEQITLNLNQNSNQEIVLNLFNSTSNTSASGSNVNATA